LDIEQADLNYHCSGIGIYAVAGMLVVFLVAGQSWGATGRNLLNNGSLDRGSGDSVDGWRIDAWILTPGTTEYHWTRPQKGRPGQVNVFSHLDNDARWVQSVSLGPGWYYISTEVSTRNVQQVHTGANVSVLEDGIMSQDLRGSNAWKPLGFYLKIGQRGADVDIALRLGSYMNLTRGEAIFRMPSVKRVAIPPPGSSRVFDLDQIRQGEARGPIGRPWTLAVTYLLLATVCAVGWLLLS